VKGGGTEAARGAAASDAMKNAEGHVLQGDARGKQILVKTW